MRRISLAVALVGAIAAAGCGGGAKPSSTSGAKGTAGVSFTVTLNNQGPGTVVSAPAGINCAANTTCSATFASGTTVVLTATVAGTNYFNGWYGDCQGTSTCSLSGNSDKYVVSYFSATPQAHSNWASGHPATGASNLNCGLCHGKNGQGLGIAPACTNCHTNTNGFLVKQTDAAPQEACGMCHATAAADHQGLYNSFVNGLNPATTQFAASIVSVTTSPGTKAGKFKATVTFTLTRKDGQAVVPANLKQKTMYFVTYNSATGTFPTPAYASTADLDPTGASGQSSSGDPANFSFGSMTAVGGQFTMVKDNLDSDPLLAPNALVYGYFGDTLLPIPVKPTTHYTLMKNIISVAKVLNGTIGYASTANVKGCEKCHGAPYSKHGYRQATVAGLNDFVSCKACHTDFRRGQDMGWYVMADNTAAWVAANETLTPAMQAQYAYTANLMNDTHNSHAFEFDYPQAVSNCITCHEDPSVPGAMNANVLTDANFNGKVCKSCHPTTSTTDIAGRAPSFKGALLGAKLSYHNFNWVDVYDANHNLIGPAGTIVHTDTATPPNVTYMKCNDCHGDDIADNSPGVHTGTIDGLGPMMYGNRVPLFKDIHSGYNKAIYADNAGTKYSATVTSSINSIALDPVAKTLTVVFSMSGLPAGAIVADPTVDGSTCVPVALYGYNTKDSVANIECVGANGTAPDATISPTGASTGPWTVVVNLAAASNAGSSAWDNYTAAAVDSTKAEIGFLPIVTLSDGTAIAASGLTATIDLTTGAQIPNQYGKQIVDTAKCNKCHEALGTTFHSPSRGSAGVLGCRLCHAVSYGSHHYEMQSKSIDSYIHAIHSSQAQNIKNVNFADPVATFEYNDHINGTYPNFTTLSCESCHFAGTYGVPDQKKSLPSVISASATLTGKTRNINGVPQVDTGPAARACGSCHRSEFINADDAISLSDLDNHTAALGYRTLDPDGSNLSTVIAGLKSVGLLP